MNTLSGINRKQQTISIPLFRLPLVLTLIDAGIAGIVVTVGPVLLAMLLRRR